MHDTNYIFLEGVRLQKQIEALQIKFSFQEETLKELNDVISDQGKELLQLKSEIRDIQLELRNERQDLKTLDKASIENELPPHY